MKDYYKWLKMVFKKNCVQKMGRKPPEKCDECGKKLIVGDVYYTVIKKHRVASHKVTGHICEACYEAKFIVV